ncbi:MAG: molecular chaperone [Haloplanus sp.]
MSDHPAPDDTRTDHGDDPAPPRRHAARAAVYAALAGAFCYPETDTVAELTDDAASEGLREAAAVLDDVDADRVERFVDAFEAADEAALRGVYDDLFGIPDSDTYPVAPYEAEYTAGEEVSHKQRRVATVSGLLDAFGLDRSEAFDERHDHVAVELELMQVLAARRAVAIDADLDDEAADLRRAEATILAEHLGTFVPAFAADVRDALDDRQGDEGGPAVDAYRAAVDLAAAFVEADDAAHPAGARTPTTDRGARQEGPP